MKHANFIRAAAFAVCAASAAYVTTPPSVSGAGATFPFPIYAKWADAYKKETGNGLNYQSIGSGGGIKQIKAKTVTFGATDAPLEAQGTRRSRPRAMADGDGRHRAGRQSRRHRAGRSRRSTARRSPRSFSARSPSGTIRRSRSSTRRSSCPIAPIAVVHRSDGSGTTFNFTDYLSKVSPDWKSKVGESDLGRMAGRHRRQGQRRRRQQRARRRARSAMSNTPTPSRTS